MHADGCGSFSRVVALPDTVFSATKSRASLSILTQSNCAVPTAWQSFDILNKALATHVRQRQLGSL